jgi:nitroimidazol reductase NimA-like FMN-containing flavoprotein (pyridoxamine 5'-phosphate oxidase superfamily)
MNFGYTGGNEKRFFFHCANEGRKLDMMEKNNYVCFELDTAHHVYGGNEACDWGTNYRSVVGYGYIRKSANDEEKKFGLDRIMEHYGAKGPFEYNLKIFERTTVLILEVTEMTGKEK